MSGSSDNPHTRAIAQFISQIKYEDIPDEVIARIKLLILDSFGCALYGSDLEWSRILRTTLGEARRDQSLPRVGNDGAFVGAACRAGQRHAHSKLRARRCSSPGRAACRRGDLAAAPCRHGTTARPERPRFPAVGCRRLRNRAARRQMHGPAAYRARLALRRDRRGVFRRVRRGRGIAADRGAAVHALGIAGTQSSGLMAAQYGAMVKRMHAGRAAQSGLYGALLAEAGFTGIVDVFESPYGGFCSTFSRSNRPVQSRRAVVAARPAVGNDAHFAEILFLRRQQPHHA